MANIKPLKITKQSINANLAAKVGDFGDQKQQISHAKKFDMVAMTVIAGKKDITLTAEEARLVRGYRGLSLDQKTHVYELVIDCAIEAGSLLRSPCALKLVVGGAA